MYSDDPLTLGTIVNSRPDLIEPQKSQEGGRGRREIRRRRFHVWVDGTWPIARESSSRKYEIGSFKNGTVGQQVVASQSRIVGSAREIRLKRSLHLSYELNERTKPDTFCEIPNVSQTLPRLLSMCLRHFALPMTRKTIFRTRVARSIDNLGGKQCRKRKSSTTSIHSTNFYRVHK